MKLTDKMIAFIGAGNMGEALIRGLLARKAVHAQQLVATDVRPDRLEHFEQTFGIHAKMDNAVAVKEADIVVLAVKPQQMSEVLAGFRASMSPDKLVISIAAGIPTRKIEAALGGKARVIRVMPNTPALVSAGAAGLSKGAHATEADLVTAESILGAVGITVRVPEDLIDAVTALSGSGPAYVFFVTEAMIAAGVKAGLTPELAKKLAIQTVHGAAKLMVETGEAPESLRRMVTSPGGTTEAAIKVMTDRKLMEIFRDAIAAATRRGKELSGS